MSVVDVLVTIIVVTILVTIVLGVVTYIAYKLRLARRPIGVQGEEATPRYFVYHAPPADAAERVTGTVAAAGGGAAGAAGAAEAGARSGNTASAGAAADEAPHQVAARDRGLATGRGTPAGELA